MQWFPHVFPLTIEKVCSDTSCVITSAQDDVIHRTPALRIRELPAGLHSVRGGAVCVQSSLPVIDFPRRNAPGKLWFGEVSWQENRSYNSER